jgi:gliding motility-associated-like protein
VYVTDVNGCVSDTSAIALPNVLPPVQPPILITSDPFILCANDSATIHLQTSVYEPIISWLPSTLSFPDTNQITIHNNQSISAFLTDTFGCVSNHSNILSFQFTPLPPAPTILASGSTSFCQGDSVRLSINGLNNISWSNGSSNNSILVQASNVYTVSGNDSCGIAHSSSTTVTVFPLPIADFDADDLKGCVPFQTQFNNLSSGGASYVWDFGDGGNSTDNAPNYEFVQPGKYDCKLVVTSLAGCKHSKEIQQMIEVVPRPIALFNYAPDSILINESTPFITFDNKSMYSDSIVWNIEEYNILSSADSIIATMTDTGNHEVQLIAISSFGCSDTLVKNIYVNGEYVMYIPNAFSPCKQDGLNDVWRPIYSHLDKKSFSLRLFDRWGKEITHITDPDKGWDGKIDGEYILGTYNFIMNCLDDRGVTHDMTGLLTLIP